MLKLIGSGLLLLATTTSALKLRASEVVCGGNATASLTPRCENGINHDDPCDMNTVYYGGSYDVGCATYSSNPYMCTSDDGWGADHCCICQEDDWEPVGNGPWNTTLPANDNSTANATSSDNSTSTATGGSADATFPTIDGSTDATFPTIDGSTDATSPATGFPAGTECGGNATASLTPTCDGGINHNDPCVWNAEMDAGCGDYSANPSWCDSPWDQGWGNEHCCVCFQENWEPVGDGPWNSTLPANDTSSSDATPSANMTDDFPSDNHHDMNGHTFSGQCNNAEAPGDRYGDGCNQYVSNPNWCGGSYDQGPDSGRPEQDWFFDIECCGCDSFYGRD